jgi:hypothetical protein
MFKIVCNRIEGMVEQENCPGDCVTQSYYRLTVEYLMAQYSAQIDSLENHSRQIIHERNEYKAKLEQCQKSGPSCPPSPSCPSCPPSPSCPSCPPPPSHTPSKRAFCDPNAFPAQFCPDQSKCPQCGEVSCPCPE